MISKVFPNIYLLVIFSITFFYLQGCVRKEHGPKFQEKLNFFEKVSERELSSSESTLVSHVGEMEVIGNQLLIGDQMSKQVMLFDTSGNFIRRISYAGDHPGGIVGNVAGIRYDNNKTYIFDNVKASVFDENLFFIKSIFIPYSIPEFCVADEKVFYYEKLNPDIASEIKLVESEGAKTVKRVSLKFPRLSCRESGNLINMRNGNLLLYVPSEFLLYMINTTGTFEKRNISLPESYILPDEDYKGGLGDIVERMKFDDKHQRSATFFVFVQKSLIFIYWIEKRNREAYIDVYDYSLNHILSEIPVKGNFYEGLKYANEDFFYGLKPPKMIEVDEIVNPTLVKYRFRHELLDSLRENQMMKK